MKPRLTPIEISLRELPPEGREFIYTRESGELNSALADLTKQNAYEVRFHLTPVGNAYDLKGQMQTSLNLQCALCAIDFQFPISQKLHELLVVQRPLEKGDQLSKANHAHEWESAGPDYILLNSEAFNVAEYIHEAIALAEPIRPLGKADCDINCENLTEPVKKYLGYGSEKLEDPVRVKPFQVLQKIKLKS